MRQPTPGRDIVLTIDPALQRAAQTLLDQALARRLPSGNPSLDQSCGGAVLVIDVHTGAVLAAASGPRFDPNAFIGGNSAEVQSLLSDSARPLLDRTDQMALPPGSVFKIISACAILAGGIDPAAPVDCQGYLHQPEALRCAVFRKYGVGHGAVTLAEAMARSCNVYFFHYAEQLGSAPLMAWAQRLGLGATSGIDLPGEAAGALPVVNTTNPRLTDPRPLAIGQGAITATPLQIVRMLAAIANDGQLVTPHIAERCASTSDRQTSTIQFNPHPRAPFPISPIAPSPPFAKDFAKSSPTNKAPRTPPSKSATSPSPAKQAPLKPAADVPITPGSPVTLPPTNRAWPSSSCSSTRAKPPPPRAPSPNCWCNEWIKSDISRAPSPANQAAVSHSFSPSVPTA